MWAAPDSVSGKHHKTRERDACGDFQPEVGEKCRAGDVEWRGRGRVLVSFPLAVLEYPNKGNLR